ncbi:hypothetical protein [Acutalibacter muris]|uniref:hypothetical protein n=1 Tax=Acutalibacter muris TaxID=1796620 RepID=UPI001C3E9E30|nr:hypothetical protein [Acutalibacter muris]
MSTARMRLSLLTPVEQAVATQNAYMIPRFLAANRLPADDWYDVVVFRYLLTVKNWFARPELYQYEFSTLAWWGMSSAIDNERRKQRRRIQTISLDEVIPGTEDVTWADVVTEDNLDYIPYTEVY